jgi:magnesium transporter
MSNLDKSLHVEEGGMPHLSLHDELGHISVLWLKKLRLELEQGDKLGAERLMSDVHAADVGDVLEALDKDERLSLVSLLGDQFDYSALAEIDDNIRSELIDDLPNADIARGVADIDSDDAVFILEDIDKPEREDILAKIPANERISLTRSLDFPEDSAGRRMQSEFIAIAPFWNVGQTIDQMRADPDLPEEFYQIYVVDPSYDLLGIIPLDKLLRAKRNEKVQDLMNSDIFKINANLDQEEAAHMFDHYDLVEVAVVDENQRMVGVLTIDDIVDVIQEEADEDFRALAGIGSETISDSVFRAVKSRITWLMVNLITAVLASAIIGLFDATIEQMVALAVLMPIVASMGGNAGTQTMTVTVRALSMRDIDRFNMRRLINREALVGLINGIIFAIIIGAVTAIWFVNIALGVIMGLAMVINMFAAGLAGILIPLGLNKLKIDPAVASSAFVTTVTDVVGFFAFLSLAAMWFNLL